MPETKRDLHDWVTLYQDGLISRIELLVGLTYELGQDEKAEVEKRWKDKGLTPEGR